MSDDALICEIDGRGVARITLNRPNVKNAFDDALISELTAQLKALDADDAVRVVVLAGAGNTFSAGADLNWMRRTAEYAQEQNEADAGALAGLMHKLNSLTKPTIAIVNGAAFGGGVGLIACCDVAIASETAKFALSEVRLGLIPAAISPFVVQAIGPRAARRYFLTGERFDAQQGLALGLLHEVAPAEELDAVGERLAAEFLKCGPQAQKEAKALIDHVSSAAIDTDLLKATAAWIARVRATAEGREGLSAFLEKRPASWLET